MRRATAAGLVLVAALAAACIGGDGGSFESTRGPVASPSTSTSTGPPGPPRCPTSYAAPDPARPRIRLTFDLADSLDTVKGGEHVVFTPDLPIRELVFRLTPNTAPSV